jgi:trimeric autotransporter adhesin
MKHFTYLFLFFVFALTQFITAQIPHTISYQGVLTVKGNLVPDGNVSLTFRLYNASEGGDTLWQESQQVSISKGIFNVILGSNEPLNLPFDEQYWLGITIEGNEELTPRSVLTSSPYSLNSHSTIAEPEQGQDLLIKNAGGEITHELNSNGDVKHTGTGTFLGGIVVGDTAAVPFDTLMGKSNKNSELLKSRIKNKTTASLPEYGMKVSGVKIGVLGNSQGGIGVEGTSKSSVGIAGYSVDNSGVYGWSKNAAGIHGESDKFTGVTGTSLTGIGVSGNSFYNQGVLGSSTNNYGLQGISHFSVGVVGSGSEAGVWAKGKLKVDSVPIAPNQERFLVWDNDNFVKFRTLPAGPEPFNGTLDGDPLILMNVLGDTVFSVMTDGTSLHKGDETFEGDVILKGPRGKGIKLVDDKGTTLAGFGRKDLDTGQRLGVYGRAQQPGDLAGAFQGDVEVRGEIAATSLHIVSTDGDTLTDFYSDGTSRHKGLETYEAGLKVTNTDGSSAVELVPNTNPVTEYGVRVNGNVMVSGILNASVIQAETKQFRIDDPLDPEHKYLNHTSVESSEMKNVYDGEVVLDRNGEAVVSLPEWFQALNIDYRYQLTCIGGYAPVYVKEEIHNNRFKIAGGQDGLKVCWQVTGIRNDKFASEHRMKVITDK